MKRKENAVAIKPWKNLVSRVIICDDFGKIFKAVTFADPHGVQYEYNLYGQRDFAVILPITKAGEVVSIRQYYQGCEKILRTLPGGNIEPPELPLLTVQREFLEETGYRCPKIIQLGERVWINTRNSWSYYLCFLGLECEKMGEQNLDDTEDIEVELVPLNEWIKLTETAIEDPCAVVTTHRTLPHLREKNII